MDDNGGSSSAAVKGGGVAAAFTVVLVWVVELVWKIRIPADVAVAMTTLFAFCGAKFGVWIDERSTSRRAPIDP